MCLDLIFGGEVFFPGLSDNRQYLHWFTLSNFRKKNSEVYFGYE